METPYSAAWRAFIDSGDGKSLIERSILSEGAHNRMFLENRIRLAFDAGWKAGLIADSARAVRIAEGQRGS